MTKPRAVKVATLWKQALCDPRGNLSANGQAMLSDLAKYCRLHEPPTRKSSMTGAVDPLETMEAIGMQKMLQRILTMVNIDSLNAARLSMTPWQPDPEDMTI